MNIQELEDVSFGGTIAVLKESGFGFIRPSGSDIDIFFHASELTDCRIEDLRSGDSVHFDVGELRGKFVALRVGKNGSSHNDFGRLTTSALPEELAGARPPLLARKFDKDLFFYFQAHPEKLRETSPGFFEELYAELLRHEGYEVEPLSSCYAADGGVDIIAVRSVGTLNIRVVIQCKRTSRKVGAEPIRALNGVLDRFSAHLGVVATTNYFTQPAILEASQSFYRISLHDFDNIKTRLKQIRAS